MIYKEIERLRFDQGLTKGELCEKSGINKGTYTRFLKGEDISLSTLNKLVKTLGMVVKIGENGK